MAAQKFQAGLQVAVAHRQTGQCEGAQTLRHPRRRTRLGQSRNDALLFVPVKLQVRRARKLANEHLHKEGRIVPMRTTPRHPLQLQCDGRAHPGMAPHARHGEHESGPTKSVIEQKEMISERMALGKASAAGT
jgi:hypothetical protein